MIELQSYNKMPDDYHNDAAKYKDKDTLDVYTNNVSRDQIQIEVTANIKIINDNINIADANIAKLDAQISKINAIDDLRTILKNASSPLGKDYALYLCKNDQQKQLINDYFAKNPGIRTFLKNEVRRYLTGILTQELKEHGDLSVLKKQKSEHENKKAALEAETNIQLNRVKNTHCKILEDANSYGIAMALSLFQLKCAKSSNDDAHIKLKEVQLAQNHSANITKSLECLRKMKGMIEDGKAYANGAQTSEYKEVLAEYQKALKVINKPVDNANIKLPDGSSLSEEQKKKLSKFEDISIVDRTVANANFGNSKDADIKLIEGDISSLTSWQSTYSSHVQSMMTELNDASSKYSTFTSGANQSLQKATDILNKLVGMF